MLLTAMCATVCVNAQTKVIDSSINNIKTEAELKVMNKTSDKIDQGIDKIFDGSVFKKKNKAAATVNNNAGAQTPNIAQLENNFTNIVFTNIDYTSLSNYARTLATDTAIIKVDKEFENGSGTLKVSHKCSSNKLLDDLLANNDNRFDVTKITEEEINLKMK